MNCITHCARGAEVSYKQTNISVYTVDIEKKVVIISI